MQKKVIIGISAMTTIVVASTMFFNFNYTKTSEMSNNKNNPKISGNENSTTNSKFPTYKISSECDVLWVSTDDLFENSDLVVLVDYKNDIKSYSSESGIPMSLSNFYVKKVYKGNLEENTIIPVNYRGGTITLEEYLIAQPQSRLAKEKFDNISKEEAKNTLIEYKSTVHDFSLKESPENYILFLNSDENSDSYSTIAADYGISKVNDTNQIYDYLKESYIDISFDK